MFNIAVLTVVFERKKVPSEHETQINLARANLSYREERGKKERKENLWEKEVLDANGERMQNAYVNKTFKVYLHNINVLYMQIGVAKRTRFIF